MDADESRHVTQKDDRRPARTAFERVDRAFARAEAEDDDGYDPWSDRPAPREALFVEDPWR